MRGSSDSSWHGTHVAGTVDASTVAASGTWRLRVQGVHRGDTGTIRSWSLTFRTGG